MQPPKTNMESVHGSYTALCEYLLLTFTPPEIDTNVCCLIDILLFNFYSILFLKYLVRLSDHPFIKLGYIS